MSRMDLMIRVWIVYCYDPVLQILIFILEYTINNWPVSSSNVSYLEEIQDSHNVRRLPAYDIHGRLIQPSQYEEKLAGAIARVCFTLVHFSIKQKHIFNAVVRDITVVRPPTAIVSSSSSLKELLHPAMFR
jgi:hypothetical protein